MLEAYNTPVGIAVDTHAKRISNKMGFSKNSEPSKIEQDLINQIPHKYFKDVNHLFMWHGRNYCNAKKPDCTNCPVNKYCDEYKKQQK
jgi:endonuclease-3